METRGESAVEVQGQAMPLSDYLASNPTSLTNNVPVLLLKVLDPKPEPVTGDLYFEVHEEKQEVYVVTHIDPHVWPTGTGGIRFGMNQDIRNQHPDGDSFRAAYLATVKRYEHIRRQIDEGGVEVDLAVERQARADMDAFAHTRELSIGDVVSVPTWTPHSLLHGVRVVEFQTPTYERFIISFAQQVLTQDHWDSEHAIQHMRIDAPAPEQFEKVSDGIERIANFEDFNVWRVDLSPATPLSLPTHIPYLVCMGLSGCVQVGDLSIQSEEACFIPHAALAKLELTGEGKLLLAAPQL